MWKSTALFTTLLFAGCALSQSDVSWYDYYTAGGRVSGLTTDDPDHFTLNGKPMKILSGAVHYFRVHPSYWRDRLQKLRAAGLNTVETYLPWNLHEEQRSVFDFGQGTTDMSPFLNLRRFVQIAREEDLFVIIRPGPYICAEWEFGGLPSWLLRDPDMKVRSSYAPYLKAADDYFTEAIGQIGDLQFTNGDGPIIAFQVENEFGAFGVLNNSRDTEYMIHLRDKMIDLGVQELFFTSDTPGTFGQLGTIPGVLQTANFNKNPEREFGFLDQFQPGKPKLVAEYWTGWFDHWTDRYHSGSTVAEFMDILDRIFALNGSVNMFMFHGGTSWGFMNGANIYASYLPDVSSYDYDAPLSEAGDYTEKYYAIKEYLAQQNQLAITMPPMPAESVKTAYPAISCEQHLTLDDLIAQLPSDLITVASDVMAMEDLPIHNGNGQSFGYLLYRHNGLLSASSHRIKIVGHVRDLAVFMVNGERLSSEFANTLTPGTFGYWALANRTLDFVVSSSDSETILDLFVENMGRNNFGSPGQFDQKKGLPEGPVLVDDEIVNNWTMYPFEFKGPWIRSLTNWRNGIPMTSSSGMYKATLTVTTPADTFILTEGWSRGVVFVNGFNLGRFSAVGPTKTLFLPAPLLKPGDNTIIVFDLFQQVERVVFSDRPQLGDVQKAVGKTSNPTV